MKKNRRHFLRNVALGIIGTSVAPVLAKTSIKPSKLIQEDCNVLTEDFYGEGPAYTENPPDIVNGVLAEPTEPGQRLIISGFVRTSDCLAVIPNTEIDIWHANDNGVYSENTDFNLRGKTYSDSLGFYSIETIVPPRYFSSGLGAWRPAHLHFKITPPGEETFTTQTYFEGDPDIPTDAAASITSGMFDATDRILPFTVDGSGTRIVDWDIIADGVLRVDNLHLTRGMIYTISPNPFEDEITIKYGVFRTANIKLEVYNLQGVLVAEVNKEELSPERYTAVWRPNQKLSSGVYICALKVNDIQVHYKKIIKK
jgi:protocatechuate 3,4-dioxygenase beta subunit